LWAYIRNVSEQYDIKRKVQKMKLTLWRIHKDKMTRKRDRIKNDKTIPNNSIEEEDSDDEEVIPDAKKVPSLFTSTELPSSTYVAGHLMTPRIFSMRNTLLSSNTAGRVILEESESGSEKFGKKRADPEEMSEKVSDESSEDKKKMKAPKKTKSREDSSKKDSSEKSDKSTSKEGSVDKSDSAGEEGAVSLELSGHDSAEE